MLTIFRLLAPFALLAGATLGLALWLLSLAELDVKASRVIIWQKNEQLAVAAEAIMDKGKFSPPIKGKFNKGRTK